MINYVIGDATYPQGDGRKLIIHCCNDRGVWGAGFVTALSKRWKQPERDYREWMGDRDDGYLMLGQVQFCMTDDENIRVANIIGQEGIRSRSNLMPVRYSALMQGFKTCMLFARAYGASVHGPRLGAGLAGGSWPAIERLLEVEIASHGVSVTIYDLEKK